MNNQIVIDHSEMLIVSSKKLIQDMNPCFINAYFWQSHGKWIAWKLKHQGIYLSKMRLTALGDKL